jgi:multiple sugar transport system substrate-binding protein
MTTFSRRGVLKGASALAAGSLTGVGVSEWATAWAQTAAWKPEAGAALSLLRWRRFIQAEEDAFNELVTNFTKATGVRSR